MLTPGQLEELRGRLLDERARLRAEIASLGREASARADCSMTDVADAASLREARLRADALRAHHERTLAEVDAALARLETGRYGISEDTGEGIPYERLVLVPWARR